MGTPGPPEGQAGWLAWSAAQRWSAAVSAAPCLHPSCTPAGTAPAALAQARRTASTSPERGGTSPDGFLVPPVRRAPQCVQPCVELCQGEWMPNLNYQPREWLWIPGAPVICGRFFRSPPVTHTRRYLSSHPRTCGVLLLHTSGPCQLQVSAGFELGVLGWICSWGWGAGGCGGRS